MRHVGGYGSALVQDLANSSSRDAKQTRKLILRQSCARQDILAQYLAGMRRSSLSVVQPIVRHRSNPLVIVFKVNVEGIFALKCERHTPVAANRNTSRTSPIALQPVQAITRQVHVCRRTRAIEHVKLPA